MTEAGYGATAAEQRARASEQRLQLAEVASGIATFELDLETGEWNWSGQAPMIFGVDTGNLESFAREWESTVFFDDLPKIRAAIESASQTGNFYVEFRATHQNGSVQWIAATGKISGSEAGFGPRLTGAIYDISERKALDARLLALNETLEARVEQVREEARALEILNETCVAVAAEHNLEHLVQMVTDAGVQLSHAAFGAFFYNVLRDDGEAYTLYTLSGAPREAFANFPMPRNSAVFEPTFRGNPPLRVDDILKDPRYGKNAPYYGMPEGHLPVRSYLAASVVSRSGEVLGGLFFGHPQPGVFTQRAEQIVTALAAQAAVAIDNARLYEARNRELAARTQAENDLQQLNAALERRAEERAQQLTANLIKLEDTERRFQLLIEGVTDYAIYMLDPSGKVVNWNAGAERIKGYTRKEILGRHFSSFYTEEDKAAEIPKRALSIATETGKYEAEGWRVRKDGTHFWASVVINALKDRKGNLLGFAKITRDLTERRAAEERARQTQKMEAIGQLTGGVAHDFNNLLTIIMGNLETLQRTLSSPDVSVERLKRSAENSMHGARRAASLTQRLLAFSRQQPLDPRPVDLGRLITGMSDLLRRTLGEQITIETVLGGGLWFAYADPNQLELSILNLAVNARDAMPDGGKLTIETANVHLDEAYAAGQAEVLPGQYAMIAVTDNGCGMTPETKARAFDPFFTTKDIGQGTGLGLSQVYGFAKQSGGHVKIYSEAGEGTTIKLYLPRVHYAAESAEEQVVAEAGTGGGETILVAEDDPNVRSYSCETLSELGYRVIEAENAKDALRQLQNNPDIRLLFTDIGLPGGMNGRQLADEVRKRRPDIGTLFTTGYARNAIVHNNRLDPGVELITKPFTQAALSAKLRDMLDARRAPGRILVVEDEPLIQMLLVDYLETAGFKVDVAGSATEAMNKLQLLSGAIDAVIVDMGLPDRNGSHLVREIRASISSLPIIIATGEGSASVDDSFERERKIGFVRKPYTATELLDALSKVGIPVAPQ
ncbi:MAG TPA: response regulator [Rhizomicrobium sp.]|jgi:PAS domain S-box-containing protein|nr:response regulator [Rhizomicrobium sp.]